MNTSDVNPQIHSQWHTWWRSQADPESINDARVVEYRKEKLQRSRRPLSCKQPEDWTELSDFVWKSDPKSEDLESLTLRDSVPTDEKPRSTGFFQTRER